MMYCDFFIVHKEIQNLRELSHVYDTIKKDYNQNTWANQSLISLIENNP